MAQNDPWAAFRVGGQPTPTQQPAMPNQDPIVRRADPYRDNAEQRAQQDQRYQAEANARAAAADARAAAAAERAAAEWRAKFNPDGTPKKPEGGGKALPDSAAKRIEGGVSNFSALSGALAGFQDDYAGNTVTGGLENTIQGAFGSFGTPGQRDWWANFQATDNVIRNDLFGATLTPSEQRSYLNTTVEPSMDPKEVRRNLKRRTDILRRALDRQRRFMVANGYNQDAVNILYEPITAMEALSGDVPEDDADSPPAFAGSAAGGQPPAGGEPPTGSQPAAPTLSPTPERQQINESGYRNEDDPSLTGVRGAYLRMLEQNVPPGQVVQQLRALGVTDPEVLRTTAQQAEFRRQNPDVPLDRYDIDKVDDRVVPLSGFEKAASALGATPLGTYAINAGQFLTGNTLDNLAADPERARAAIDVANVQNPNAALAGQISGGILGAMGGEALLARAGMAPGFLRGLAADTVIGAANGAGMADNGNRATNALLGAGAAAAGNVAGNALMRGAARVVAPTGGDLGKLYEAGVRPTLGQRFANSGVIGRAVNATEEALQSVPFVGASIQGARQEARDQFQIGAFNEALKEVGEQLPKGMRPGTDPHAYAQKTFERVYAEARSGMRLVGDEQLASDLAQIDEGVKLLSEPSIKRFNTIFENIVARRVQDGELSGPAFKKTISDLGKQIRALRNSPSGDGELAGALQDLQGVLDNAARRHSDPDAVALLDAADAGYAKFVRIEDAAARAGGDAGTFTPTQFERAVQKQEGGTRSKAFLRGDALMQDYAEQGKTLTDRTPNSGTTDRAMVAGTLGAGVAAYLNPKFLAFLGAVGVGYAPGVRKATTGALAPAGVKRKAIGEQLKKRARLVGAAGAATGAAALPGTSPGQ